MNFDDIRKELEIYKYDLLSKANVVSVGIGYKISKGSRTSILSIICSVEHKKPKLSLTFEDLIPETVNGILTDVVETGEIKALGNITKQRPALGGDSIGHYAITAGTLGCVVKKSNEVMILSNNHVLANSNNAQRDDMILQPGPHDGGEARDQIAKLKEWVHINFIEDGLPSTDCSFAKGTENFLNFLATVFNKTSRIKAYSTQTSTNLVDAALAKPVDNEYIQEAIRGIGRVAKVVEAVLGMQVQKQGRTTGLTKGVIEQIDVTTRVSYGTGKTAIFTDQLIISSITSDPFSLPGDSGSIVLSDSNVIGLLFAGNETITVVNRIQNVFKALGCTLV